MPFLSSSHGHGASASGQLVHAHQSAPVYIHQQQRQPSPQAYSSSPQKSRKPSVFRQFNHHAETCSRCAHPLEVVRRGDQLCDEGHELAYEVARQLYKLGAEAAQRYEGASDRSCVNILVDFTRYDGPVYELAKALDKGLNKRAKSEPKESEMAVYYQPLQRRESSSSPPTGYYTTNASSSRRAPSNSSSSGSAAVPRGGGSIRVSLPVEAGREAEFYEEIQHFNGGRVTTKYYHADQSKPRLPREDSFKEPASSKPRRSRNSVHFDPEVKYYT